VKDGRLENEKKCQRKGEHIGKWKKKNAGGERDQSWLFVYVFDFGLVGAALSLDISWWVLVCMGILRSVGVP
jgi:hypothetical protein